MRQLRFVYQIKCLIHAKMLRILQYAISIGLNFPRWTLIRKVFSASFSNETICIGIALTLIFMMNMRNDVSIQMNVISWSIFFWTKLKRDMKQRVTQHLLLLFFRKLWWIIIYVHIFQLALREVTQYDGFVWAKWIWNNIFEHYFHFLYLLS